MYKYLPITANKKQGKYENFEYLPFVMNLFSEYKDLLTDDYYPESQEKLVYFLLNEINSLYPWFLVVLNPDNEPIGVTFLSHWHGNGTKYHSCQVHAVFDKKYWGIPVKEASIQFFDYLFNSLNLERIQMEIPDFNRPAQIYAYQMKFKKEGIIRHATFKDKKPLNNVLFSLIKGDFNHGQR